MRLTFPQAIRVAIALAALLAVTPASFSATNANAEIIPLIVIDDVPLVDAVKNLARQAGLNFIMDPRVAGSSLGPGSKTPSPSVTLRWQNRAAGEALDSLLKVHKLAMVTNPVTTVARIVPAGANVKPVPGESVGTNTSKKVPLMVFDGISLRETMEAIGREAGLGVAFDQAFLESEYTRSPWAISFRWTDITPRQALAALVDNYNLEMKEDVPARIARVSLKAAGAAPQ